MSAQAVIRYKLGLVLRLLDALTGKVIIDRNVKFKVPGNIGPPVARGDGVYLFMNIPREDFMLEVQVYGYELAKAGITFADIDEQMPTAEIFLVPADVLPRSENLLTLKGQLEGIESIECISLHEVAFHVKDFNPKNKVMTLFNPHKVNMDFIRYGAFNDSYMVYDRLEILKELSSSQIELKHELEHGFYENQSVMKIIKGITDGDEYILRVPSGKNARYLVCFTARGKKYYQKMDFHQPEELLKGGT